VHGRHFLSFACNSFLFPTSTTLFGCGKEESWYGSPICCPALPRTYFMPLRTFYSPSSTEKRFRGGMPHDIVDTWDAEMSLVKRIYCGSNAGGRSCYLLKVSTITSKQSSRIRIGAFFTGYWRGRS